MQTTKASSKKLKIGIKVGNETYWITSKTRELLSKLFIISEARPKYRELRAYKGVGERESQLLAEALSKPINYPNNMKNCEKCDKEFEKDELDNMGYCKDCRS